MKELVQCSRCLSFQTADISETCAIECKSCGEVDACFSGDEIIEIL